MHIVTLERITSTLNDTVLPKRFASIWQQGKIANMKLKRARINSKMILIKLVLIS